MFATGGFLQTAGAADLSGSIQDVVVRVGTHGECMITRVDMVGSARDAEIGEKVRCDQNDRNGYDQARRQKW